MNKFDTLIGPHGSKGSRLEQLEYTLLDDAFT